ncbi:MAG TPA: cysteine hydrolase family protein [Cyclobacteriaceae bacterium]
MKALLIIDMQNESFPSAYPSYDTDGVIMRINQLSAEFHRKGDKVIYIQHDGSKQGCYIQGTEGWKLLSALDKRKEDTVISKKANDSFYQTSLKDELSKLNVTEIVITGSATDFCVDATVKSALINDFNVTIIADAHTTTGSPHVPAKQLIDHYNWVWGEMTPTGRGTIAVIRFDEFM